MKRRAENQIALSIEDEEGSIHIETLKPSRKIKEAPSRTDFETAYTPQQPEPATEASDAAEQDSAISFSAPVAEEPEAVEAVDFESPDDKKAVEAENLTSFGSPMSSITPKPKMLLETPYKVSNKKGEHMRYRLEYDYADKSVPSESISMLDNIESANTEIPPKPLYTIKKKRVKKFDAKKEILDWVKAIGIAVILTLLIRTFVFVVVTVDGPSMQPTLQDEERLIVTRYDYYLHEPERGDIVICRFNNEYFPDRYVKRVIGLPGETIEVTDGITYINGVALVETYIQAPPIDDFPATLIPEDCYFVMGDNRNDSTDSRRVGVIPKNLLIGHARTIVYPFDKWGSLKEEE